MTTPLKMPNEAEAALEAVEEEDTICEFAAAAAAVTADAEAGVEGEEAGARVASGDFAAIAN